MESPRTSSLALLLALVSFVVAAGCGGGGGGDPEPPGGGIPDPANHAPVIDALVAQSTAVVPGGSATVAVEAHDDDAGAVLSYTWSASAGTFTVVDASTTVWTAPAGLVTAATARLTVVVADERGETATAFVDVGVSPASACEGTFTASPDAPNAIAGRYACSPTYSAAPPPSLALTRLFFAFTSLDGANGGDARLPRFTFAGVPAAGTSYPLAELASASAVVWWQNVGVDDLYTYVAAVHDRGVTAPVGSGTIDVTTVTPLAAGGHEIHGRYDLALVPRPGVIFNLDPRFDDPIAKLPQDATGSIRVQGTF